MNCREFKKCMGDYVNRTLGEDIACEAEVHLSVCPGCAAMSKELEATSLMVGSLERKSAPAGFEERLRVRLCPQVETRRSWLRRLADSFISAPASGRRLALRPALAVLLLCVVVLGSVFVFTNGRPFAPSNTDWGYIEACKEQHESFAAANPLADDSAIVLRQRVMENNL